MSAVVNNPQRQTYQERANETLDYYSTIAYRIGLLSTVVDVTTKPYEERVKTFLSGKQLVPLKEYMTESYCMYEKAVQEKAVAEEALQIFQEAIAYLTPGNVQRTPTQEIHLVKLGIA